MSTGPVVNQENFVFQIQEKWPTFYYEQHLSLEDSGRCWKPLLTCSARTQNSSWRNGLPTTDLRGVFRRGLSSSPRNPHSEVFINVSEPKPPFFRGTKRKAGPSSSRSVPHTHPGASGRKPGREQVSFLNRPRGWALLQPLLAHPCSPKDVPGRQEAGSFDLKRRKKKKRTERERVAGIDNPVAFPRKMKAAHQPAETGSLRWAAQFQPPFLVFYFLQLHRKLNVKGSEQSKAYSLQYIAEYNIFPFHSNMIKILTYAGLFARLCVCLPTFFAFVSTYVPMFTSINIS